MAPLLGAVSWDNYLIDVTGPGRLPSLRCGPLSASRSAASPSSPSSASAPVAGAWLCSGIGIVPPGYSRRRDGTLMFHPLDGMIGSADGWVTACGAEGGAGIGVKMLTYRNITGQVELDPGRRVSSTERFSVRGT